VGSKGNMIWLLSGCEMPFALREYQDGCITIGAGYLCGLLDGNSTEFTPRSESSRFIKL
jgi:hypothetical protein